MLDWTQWFQSFAYIFSGWTIGALLIAAGACAWFRIPALGHYLGLAGIVAGCCLIWGAIQYKAAADHCQDAVLRARVASKQNQIDELDRQIKVGRALADAAQQREAAAQAEADAANERIAEYDKWLAENGNAGDCPLTDELWKRLRP